MNSRILLFQWTTSYPLDYNVVTYALIPPGLGALLGTDIALVLLYNIMGFLDQQEALYRAEY